MNDVDRLRRRRIIDNAIRDFELDLDGLVVVTELGSRDYLFTPVIAALAGARRVFAVVRDSKYGTVSDLEAQLAEVTAAWSLPDVIEVCSEVTDEAAAQADIVTNSGMLRPLDASLIARLKPEAAIPLMWETWEFRPAEVDIDAARERGILVQGTREEFLYRNNGFLASKLLFEAGAGVWKDRVLVVASGRIGKSISWFFEAVGVDHMLFAPAAGRAASGLPGSPLDEILEELESFDAIVVAEHVDNALILGGGGYIDVEALAARNPAVRVVHVCGGVDADAIRAAGLSIHPHAPAPPGYMTVSAAHLDSHAVLELNTAGLRVGEIMSKARKRWGLPEAYEAVRNHPLVDDFPGGYLQFEAKRVHQ